MYKKWLGLEFERVEGAHLLPPFAPPFPPLPPTNNTPPSIHCGPLGSCSSTRRRRGMAKAALKKRRRPNVENKAGVASQPEQICLLAEAGRNLRPL